MRSRYNTRLVARARRLARLLALLPEDSEAAGLVMLEAAQLVLDCGTANLLLEAGDRIERLADAEPIGDEAGKLRLTFEDGSHIPLDARQIGNTYHFQHVLAETPGSAAALIAALTEAEEIVRFGDAEPQGTC